MVENVKVSLQYVEDKQWRVDFTINGKEDSIQHLDEYTLVSLCHCIAKELGLPYDESEIERTYDKKHYNQYNRGWALCKTWSSQKELLRSYKYDNIYDICRTTYGCYDVEDLKTLITEISKWLSNNDIHRLSYENVKPKYIFYLKHNIGFRFDEEFLHYIREDKDFTQSKMQEYDLEHKMKIWKHKTENAIQLNKDLFVKMNDKHLIFYQKDDIAKVFVEYFYPSLNELKNNSNFILAMSNYYISKLMIDTFNKFMEWANGECDYPYFPLETILDGYDINSKYNIN